MKKKKKAVKFRHSGDMGDIIYSLPVVKALGGGELYLDVSGGVATGSVWTKLGALPNTKFCLSDFNFLKPLLLEQDYIAKVEVWTGQDCDHDLDLFRKAFFESGASISLLEAHCKAFGMNMPAVVSPWLTVKEKTEVRPFVCCRNLRMCAGVTFWERHMPLLEKFGVFIGTDLEHEAIQSVTRHSIDRYQVKDALGLASAISGCKQYVGNLTLGTAIAEGLGAKCVIETHPLCIPAPLNRGDIYARF